jgi:uncharacterized protein
MTRGAGGGSLRSRDSAVRRCLGGWVALLFFALFMPRAADAQADEQQFFRIGTAATTGTYFQIGGVLASAISKPPGARDCEHGGGCGVPGLVAIAQASQGSIQNVLAVGSGQLESALAQSDIAYWAYTGSAIAPRRCGLGKEEVAARTTGAALLKSRGALRNLRAIAGLYPEDIHVVVRAESSIRALQDLKGKRVALGEPESGTLADARLVLEAAGLNECEMKADYLGLSEAADGLAQMRIDAFFVVGGYPVPAITEAATATPIRLLPVPRDVADRLARKYAFFEVDTIPAGSYPGIETDTPTLSTTALWVVREDVPEDLVYLITRALWSEATKRLLDAGHPVGRRIRLASALEGVTIPLHLGAARFYREVGLKLPDSQ